MSKLSERHRTPFRTGSKETASPAKQGDIQTLATANEVLDGTSRKGYFARLLPFLGPAFMASIAYIDPGNYATNIQAGAKFGYRLLWVIVASNLMAMIIQTMSAKLGIATGMNLAELMRDRYPRWAGFGMWMMMEIVAMATDLAEFLGAALGVYLLFPGLFQKIGALSGLPDLLIPAILMGGVDVCDFAPRTRWLSTPGGPDHRPGRSHRGLLLD